MKLQKSTAFLVTDADLKVMGIISEQDIVRRVLAEGRDPCTTTVDQVMTLNPVTLPELGKLQLEDEAAMQLMSKGNFRHVPIVDQKGRLLRSVDVMSAASASIARRPSFAEALGKTAKKFMRLYGKSEKNELLIGGGHQIPAYQLVQGASVTVKDAAQFMKEKKLSAVLVSTKYGVRFCLFFCLLPKQRIK